MTTGSQSSPLLAAVPDGEEGKERRKRERKKVGGRGRIERRLQSMSNSELELFPCLLSQLYLFIAPKMTNRYPQAIKVRSGDRVKGWKNAYLLKKVFELLIVQSPWQIRGC